MDRRVFEGVSWGRLGGTAVGLVAAWLLTPAQSRACGGFFCSTAPVVQSGETIVYGLEDDGTLTMSIRLESQGVDEDFAWILPLTVAPTEISVGTDALFDQLEVATRPYFVRAPPRVEGECRAEPVCLVPPAQPGDYGGGGGYYGAGCGVSRGFGPDARPPSYASIDASGPLPDVARPPTPDAAWSAMDGGVAVLREERVGPYDTVVLGAATAAEVVEWLRSHDYDIPLGADTRLEAYAAARHVFLALRLSSSVARATIRPITLRLPTSEACLPIRLTALSTVPDMPIHAYFLARAPVTPWNYSVADPAFTSIALWQGRDSYQRHADAAIDAFEGGHAFAPLFSGPTPLVPVELPSLGRLADVEDAALLLQGLVERGYQPTDLVFREVLARHLESPTASRTNLQYWNCLVEATDDDECGGPPVAFDPGRFVSDVEENVSAPRAAAQRLLERLPHLTRLYTSMSDFEMDVDPVFVVDEGIEDVSNVHTLVQERSCSPAYVLDEAPLVARVPGGETVTLEPGVSSTDESFCARSGRITRAEYDRIVAQNTAMAEPPRPPPAMRSSGCCGIAGCATHPPPRGATVPILLFGLAVWARRRRREPRSRIRTPR